MIRVLHFADLINRDDFIHNVISSSDPRQFSMAAATLSARGTLNADPRPLDAVHDLDCASRAGYPRAAWRLRRLVAAEAIDILHTHHYEPALIGVAATVGRPVPLVLGRHYSDAIYQLARGLRRRAYLSLEALANRRAAAIIAPSTAVAQILLSQGVAPEKVEVIPYGFDFRRFGPRGEEALARARALWPAGEGPRLVTVGRLHAEKGHRYLLDALETLAREGLEARWLVVGDGPERDRLAAQVAASAVADRVRFAGWRTDVLDLVAAADVVVQPTVHEAFSQAMVEAMALGRPLVISDVSGVRDIVEDERSGLIVPLRDSAALARAIRRLADRGQARAMGEAARARVQAALALTTVMPRLEALYRRLVART